MSARSLRGRWSVCVLVCAAAAAGPAAAALGFEPEREFPDTTDGIHVFVDQLNVSGMSVAQKQFAASHYVGTQKQVSAHIDALRVYNPDFIMIQYRLGTRESGYPGGAPYIHGDRWYTDWPSITINEDWFIHDDQGNRVYQLYGASLREYCMDISGLIEGDTTYGWKEYWVDCVLSDVDASHADGVFADSTHLPYSVPSSLWDSPMGSPPHRELIPHMEIFYDYVYQRFDQANRYFIPNIGGLVTTVDTTNGYYEDVHGAMVEGFGVKRYGLTDWKLQCNRTLRLIRNGKIYIAQNGPDGGWSDMKDRGWLVGNFLLLKGDRSYLNMLGVNSQLHWWPEYDIDIGAPISPGVPASVDALIDWASGLYARRFEHGVVLVNAGYGTRTYPLRGTLAHVLITPYGGGEIWSNGQVERPTGLTYTVQTTPLVMEGWSGAVMVRTLPGDANLDWEVGIADLAALADNYGRVNATWVHGEFTGDGLVGIADLAALADNYGDTVAGLSPVPEPTVLILLALGAGCIPRRRR